MQAVFIDIDNTLLDFDEYVRRTMQTGFAHFGLPPYRPDMYEVFTRENNRLWRQIEQGTLTFDELQKIRWRNIFRALAIDFDGITFERYFRHAIYDSAIPVPGAYDMLDALKSRNLVLCAASNGPDAQQRHRLDLAGMTRYFDHCFISEHIGASKPSRAFFDEVFRRLNAGRPVPIRPEAALMLGDSLTSDIAGGMQYGMKTCLYRRDPAIAPPRGVDAVIDDLHAVAAGRLDDLLA